GAAHGGRGRPLLELEPRGDAPRVQADGVAAAHVAVVLLLRLEVDRAEELPLVVAQPLDVDGHPSSSYLGRIASRTRRAPSCGSSSVVERVATESRPRSCSTTAAALRIAAKSLSTSA